MKRIIAKGENKKWKEKLSKQGKKEFLIWILEKQV
jgi:hypothetical protein